MITAPQYLMSFILHIFRANPISTSTWFMQIAHFVYLFSALRKIQTAVIARRAKARRSNPPLKIASRPEFTPSKVEGVARNDKIGSSTAQNAKHLPLPTRVPYIFKCQYKSKNEWLPSQILHNNVQSVWILLSIMFIF